MSDLTALQSFWILAVNTLLHELGLPLPVMPTAFVMGARGVHGAGDLLLLIAALAAGMVIGNSVWFAAGRHYGAGVLKFLCRFSLTADTCVSRTERVFGRWGWSSLVVGRFLPGVSLVAPPLAGALGMTCGDSFAQPDRLGAAGAAEPRLANHRSRHRDTRAVYRVAVVASSRWPRARCLTDLRGRIAGADCGGRASARCRCARTDNAADRPAADSERNCNLSGRDRSQPRQTATRSKDHRILRVPERSFGSESRAAAPGPWVPLGATADWRP